MEINKKQDGSTLEVALAGRLDTTTAPQLEQELLESLDGVTELTLDCEKLEYISSSGLRVLLTLQRRIQGKGRMTVKNVSEIVYEVFEVTGFTSILRIE